MDELNDQEELKIAIERVKINRRNLEAYDLFEAFRGQFIIASFFSAINFQAENFKSYTISLFSFFFCNFWVFFFARLFYHQSRRRRFFVSVNPFPILILKKKPENVQFQEISVKMCVFKFVFLKFLQNIIDPFTFYTHKYSNM